MIPYGRQDINQDDIEAVADVLKSDFLTQGPAVPAFEKALAGRVGASYAVAMNSATSGLHAAYAALGVGPGDTVWTSPITFVASANAARMLGADVGFVDVEPDTLNMDVSDLAERLEAAKKFGRLPKVVTPVHFTGRPCHMEPIASLGRAYGFRVVEDAAHAIGAECRDAPIGQCLRSDIAVFSFHPVKIITTAEGGCATTNDDELAAKMRMFISHGITKDPSRMVGENEGSWYYQQLELGYNYRMTDIQAALGLSQLKRLDGFLAARRALVKRYDRLLEGLPLQRPPIEGVDRAAWHLYVIQLSEDAPPRKVVFEALRERGIGVQVHYIPVHLQPYYRDQGFMPGEYPVAEKAYARCISLPLYATLTEDDQDTVVATLKDILKG